VSAAGQSGRALKIAKDKDTAGGKTALFQVVATFEPESPSVVARRS
jgi:hypothetical protein